MVGKHISLQSLNLDELTGVVNLYPWYAAARMELCRRMFALGPDAWSEEEFAAQALYVADRGRFSDMVRSAARPAFEDADAQKLLASLLEAPAAEPEKHAVRVVGGDYFSQAQYDKVSQEGEGAGIFSRMALQQGGAAVAVPEEGPVADRFTTETLAAIFLEQGQYEEARRIYSRLVLDIPEKSAYFASLIEKIDNL